MGTSSSYGGPRGGTPLVPSWLTPDNAGPLTSPEDVAPDTLEYQAPILNNAQPTEISDNQDLLSNNRFTRARTNLSRFAKSKGTDRASLGRAISHYVSSASGGARKASQRMGASRHTGAALLNFLTNVVTRGVQSALKSLELDSLVGRPIGEVFLGLADHLCPANGTIDAGIARDAFIDTIADLSVNDINDLNNLQAGQIQIVFELYIAHTIEKRLYNDIGTKLIFLPDSARLATQIQGQLHDFIRGAVSDALSRAKKDLSRLTSGTIQRFVNQVYEQAFVVLQALGQGETEQ